MPEVFRGSDSSGSLERGLSGSGSSPQESTSDVIRVTIGQGFKPFSALGELPVFDPEQGSDQDIFSVALELDGIRGSLTLFPNVQLEEDNAAIKKPRLGLEAKFRIESFEQFDKLKRLKLQLDTAARRRHMDLGLGGTGRRVRADLQRGDGVSEINVLTLHKSDCSTQGPVSLTIPVP